MSFALFTLHTLLHAIICCLQLNTGSDADADLKVDYLGIDAVGITVYVLCCNAQLDFIVDILACIALLCPLYLSIAQL